MGLTTKSCIPASASECVIYSATENNAVHLIDEKQVSMCFSCVCMFYSHRHWMLLFRTIPATMFMVNNLGRQRLCLPLEQRAGLLSSIIVITPPSRVKI